MCSLEVIMVIEAIIIRSERTKLQVLIVIRVFFFQEGSIPIFQDGLYHFGTISKRTCFHLSYYYQIIKETTEIRSEVGRIHFYYQLDLQIKTVLYGGYNLNIQSFIFMDEAQLRQLIPPKQQNPLLKRKPLNLGNKFTILSKQEESVQFQNTLNQPHITLLFFAAEWCNVCKSFIPFLKKFYEEVNLEYKRIQIIYVGLDKVKKDYEQFTKTMPWIGLPFADQRISGLKEFYDIRAIPKLLLLDVRGEQVKNNCRQDVYNLKQDDAFEKWLQLKTTQQKSYFYS